jgi:hypothetical protein
MILARRLAMKAILTGLGVVAMVGLMAQATAATPAINPFTNVVLATTLTADDNGIDNSSSAQGDSARQGDNSDDNNANNGSASSSNNSNDAGSDQSANHAQGGNNDFDKSPNEPEGDPMAYVLPIDEYGPGNSNPDADMPNADMGPDSNNAGGNPDADAPNQGMSPDSNNAGGNPDADMPNADMSPDSNNAGGNPDADMPNADQPN